MVHSTTPNIAVATAGIHDDMMQKKKSYKSQQKTENTHTKNHRSASRKRERESESLKEK